MNNQPENRQIYELIFILDKFNSDGLCVCVCVCVYTYANTFLNQINSTFKVTLCYTNIKIFWKLL